VQSDKYDGTYTEKQKLCGILLLMLTKTLILNCGNIMSRDSCCNVHYLGFSLHIRKNESAVQQGVSVC
jgi:hypothetical protein